jgi:protein-disulfide isomerase
MKDPEFTMHYPARILCLFLLLFFVPSSGVLGSESPLTQSQIKEALQQVLKENPELILDVLRDNSIAVLEIAQQGGQERQRKIMRARWETDVNIPKAIDLDRPMRGPVDAPVTIVAYSDYTCPYCARAAATINQVLAARMGKVRFLFKHYPQKGYDLGRLSSEYVAAAFLQDAAKAWAMHDAVFAGQDRLGTEGEGFLRITALDQGLNLQKLGTDIKSRKVKTLIDEDITEGETLKITGTPFHLVNDLTVPGAAPLSSFLEAVDLAAQIKAGKK